MEAGLTRACSPRNFTRKKLCWMLSSIAVILLLKTLCGITNLPENLGLDKKNLKKSLVSALRDFKAVNPIAPRCSSHISRLVPVKGGRLGNWMFQYASASSIARRLGMEFVLSGSSELLSIFKLKPGIVGEIKMNDYTEIQENFACVYDPSLLELPCGTEVHLCCYLQSWKYFKGFESDIRSQFGFNSRVENLTQFYWNTVILPAVNKKHDITFIAVHIRRGDKLDNQGSVNFGTTVATKEYLLRGYEFFINKFGGMDTQGHKSRNMKVLFVVCSDDLPWARQVLPHESSVFVDSGSPEVDMAVLSRCNHTLMTVGTFGWWVAWLVDGVTVYYKHIFRPESLLARSYNNTLVDWVLPNWIPME